MRTQKNSFWELWRWTARISRWFVIEKSVVCVGVGVSMCLHLCVWLCVCVCVCVCMWGGLYVHVCVGVPVPVYMYMCVTLFVWSHFLKDVDLPFRTSPSSLSLPSLKFFIIFFVSHFFVAFWLPGPLKIRVRTLWNRTSQTGFGPDRWGPSIEP